jgi:putative transposase
VAAYIDLNPVRAGLVDDPKDYRWCVYSDDYFSR